MATQASTRVVNGINTRVLHNKDYVEVPERVRILHELRKAGEISDFEMIESQPFQFGPRWVWIVKVMINGKLYIGNAEIKQDAPKNTPDGTNPFECAETSAFGRALAFAGLGTLESIASYDEVMRGKPFVAVIEQTKNKVVESGNAPKQLPVARPDLSNHVKALKDRALALGCANAEQWEALLNYLGIETINGEAEIAKVHAYLDKREQKQQAASEKAAVGSK